ncbi:hypothetical protein TVAG_444470 [Trichomonas vaginalis G3]|uniref:Uncharacterized protein n=1 Tax=Trichomonas vaginalis (strain ATCC PRA-98 / G3) TaxID=412133 RepID=A2E2I8_TRIV3|nr:hypothetical protein TVAGG3_0306260 [Trichomonas vaginalis G3]EAY13163.1 hypothetical protein TVAG_444470 [Trichomonas vaginalis G3]KAI5528276.1 hypothetical protein TVAGG3_0306260 [Trichomonas vaginalis G3]|eukprot:XP_001325386.1 hypothetical protein [Trichomonas vaginalis G3]
MNQCNITQNRVKGSSGGYTTQYITSDSFITCVNVIENNQSSGWFNYHSKYSSSTSKFKVSSCNYIRNKDSKSGGSLIYTNTDLIMSYCCILENEITYIFEVSSATMTFENSTTDSTVSTRTSPIFKNTNISSCPLFKNSIPTEDLNEEEKEDDFYIPYIKKPIKFVSIFALIASACS